MILKIAGPTSIRKEAGIPLVAGSTLLGGLTGGVGGGLYGGHSGWINAPDESPEKSRHTGRCRNGETFIRFFVSD